MPALRAYLADGLVPDLEGLGFATEIHDNPDGVHGPFLIATRHEGDTLPTVLIYGHGDTVRGYPEQWRAGLDPWRVVVEGDRWYGRGTADNKGQHVLNIAALAQVMAARAGRLGFNTKLLIEMGEEAGSPGLREVLPRPGRGARGRRAHRLRRPASQRRTADAVSRLARRLHLRADRSICARARTIPATGADCCATPARCWRTRSRAWSTHAGSIRVAALRPPPIPEGVRAALADIRVGEDPTAPRIDTDWGEPGLSPAERVFAWNTLEVLAFKTGDPEGPLNAVPPSAKATLQLRFVVGTDWQNLLPALRSHLDAHGFPMVSVRAARSEVFRATRLPVEDPWVAWAMDSIAASTGKSPALLPNLGGSLPNDAFAEILGMPTLWIPHSYPACLQHGPDEHMLGSMTREALAIMAGLFWDLGETGPGVLARRRAAIGRDAA